MSNPSFDHPFLNSPYANSSRHWELDENGPTPDDWQHLIVEIKGYRRGDAKEKKATMDTYWIPGVNNLGTYGRWAFAEFTDIYEIESDFKAKVAKEFDSMISKAVEQSKIEVLSHV
jgi:type III restriction enzyme